MKAIFAVTAFTMFVFTLTFGNQMASTMGIYEVDNSAYAAQTAHPGTVRRIRPNGRRKMSCGCINNPDGSCSRPCPELQELMERCDFYKDPDFVGPPHPDCFDYLYGPLQ